MIGFTQVYLYVELLLQAGELVLQALDPLLGSLPVGPFPPEVLRVDQHLRTRGGGSHVSWGDMSWERLVYSYCSVQTQGSVQRCTKEEITCKNITRTRTIIKENKKELSVILIRRVVWK